MKLFRIVMAIGIILVVFFGCSWIWSIVMEGIVNAGQTL